MASNFPSENYNDDDKMKQTPSNGGQDQRNFFNPQQLLHEKNRLEAATNEEVKKIRTDVQLTLAETHQSMFDRRNAGNQEWQMLQDEGRKERNQIVSKTIQSLEEISSEDKKFRLEQEQELAYYSEQRLKQDKKAQEEAEAQKQLLEQEKTVNLSKLKKETEKADIEFENRLKEAKMESLKIVVQNVAKEESTRKETTESLADFAQQKQRELEEKIKIQKLERERIKKESEEKRQKASNFFTQMPTFSNPFSSSKKSKSKKSDGAEKSSSNYNWATQDYYD